MTYEESVEYLNSLRRFGIRTDLGRISAMCERFGNPQNKLRSVHVAGTNGKGSTCTFISSILRHADFRVGLYLSPYVRDLRERIQINGMMIPHNDFADLIARIKPVADEIAAADHGPVTEFEVKTMAAYLYFAERQVDFAVFETGMGGRFDATNLVHPLVAVITGIGLDHTEWLGDTVEKIAYEKAGIIKNGSVVVTSVDDDAAWRVILKQCRDEGNEVWRVMTAGCSIPGTPSADVQLKILEDADAISVRNNGLSVAGLKPSLPGRFQYVNAAAAVAAVLALRRFEIHISERAIRDGIADARIPGRLELLRDRPKLVVDGAHNPDAARVLAATLKETFKYEKMILVIGMLDNHSAGGVLQELVPLASHVIATQSQWKRALSSEDMANAALEWTGDVERIENVPDAVAKALEIASPKDLVLVTGSFTTVGEVPERYTG